MTAPFDIAIRNKRPAPPSEAGSDQTVTPSTAAQEQHPPDPQPGGTWEGVVEVRHKKQKRDEGDESEGEVACGKSPESGQEIVSKPDGQWDFMEEYLQAKMAAPRRGSTIHEDAAPGSDSSESEEAEDGDEEPDEPVFSQVPERPDAVEYRGEEYTGGKGIKARKLQQFYERTETFLEHYLDDTLCPYWPKGDRKTDMDWDIKLIDRLTDLHFLINDCAEFNALLHAEVGERYRRNLKYTPPPQVQMREVERVIHRVKAKRARQA